MKTLYFECNMGAAGDLLMAALLELHENSKDFINRLNNIGIPDVTVTVEKSVKCGITGTHIKVNVNGHEEAEQGRNNEGIHSAHISPDVQQHEHNHSHEHSHSDYHGIEHLIGHLNVSDSVKKDVLEVYNLIAEAESRAHGVPVNQIHFHEVGEMDAIADIVGVCMLIWELSPDVIVSSPINTGKGHVHCAHGVLPVPAPATAHILRGVPVYNDEINGELCTPTGAALLKYFAGNFRDMPLMTVSGIGYGMGKKDFNKANCLRAYIGNADDNEQSIVELVCNLDDMTPESVAFALEILLENSALDVYTTPIGMKKGRTGLSLTCMCKRSDKDKMLSLIFKHTTTLGIREYASRRYTLKKEYSQAKTKFGMIRIKTSYGFGVKKTKPEYEDIARIARENGISLRDVLKEIELDNICLT
jgi:uncharacterized protein (TIGR00299 family) protein